MSPHWAMDRIPVPVPPFNEQSEIVRRVESLFASADRLETRHAAARAQVERLTPALLTKAFRGELLPQDPDEPASELLKRLGQRPSTIQPVCRNGGVLSPVVRMRRKPHQAPERK